MCVELVCMLLMSTWALLVCKWFQKGGQHRDCLPALTSDLYVGLPVKAQQL